MANKKKMVVRESAIIKKREKSPEWRSVTAIYGHEMKPILETLQNETIPTDIKNCLKNYIVITLVSTIENQLRAIARRNVDQWNTDISKVVEGEVTIPLSAFESIAKKQITKGSLVAANFNFAKPDQIDDFFSKTMGLKCFETIKELDRLDPSNYFHYAASLNRNWKKFMQMFELRDELVHRQVQITLSVKQLTSLCNCTMNFLDAAQVVCYAEFRPGIESRLGWLRQRQIRKERRQAMKKGMSRQLPG